MRRRLPVFFVIVTVILLLLFGYIGARLAAGAGAWLALAVPFLAVWLMPVLLWRGERQDSTLLVRSFSLVSFLSMGFLSFLLVSCLLRDALIGLSYLLAPVPWQANLSGREGAALAAALALLATLLGTAVSYLGLRTKTVDVAIPGLPPGLDGLRIAQISDLHVGPTIRSGYVRRVVARTLASRPDLVALTGDIVDGTLAELRQLVAPLAELGPKGRVYFVPGNHEYYWNAPAWLEHFRALGAEVLSNRGVLIEHGGERLWVGGVTDQAAAHGSATPAPDAALAAAGGRDAAARILLAHQPQIAKDAEAAGFDLQLSGHTHAGQFFPWTLVVRFFHPHFHGLSRSGRMWVYVSPGTGSWGPPVRVGTIPEVTLIRLVTAP